MLNISTLNGNTKLIFHIKQHKFTQKIMNKESEPTSKHIYVTVTNLKFWFT